MKIEALNDWDVQSVLQNGFFKIPRFQRPYRWERENVEDFWKDAIVDAQPPYFIGSIVVFKMSENVYGIVDGQQRLTTITMLLCALRNQFHKIRRSDLALGLHNLIERPDLNNRLQFILQPETSYPYLQEYIQKDGEPELVGKSGEEERNLQSAFEFITRNLENDTNAIETQSTLSEEARSAEVTRVLTHIRDKVLRLKVIYIQLDKEDDAYTIFETLNTRGKDLDLSDLVKSHITKLLGAKNANVDPAKETWQGMVTMLANSQSDLTMNEFLHHYWLSKHDYLPAKRLYKAIKRQVKDRANAREFLRALESDCQTYCQVIDPATRKWTKQELSIRQSLEAVMYFTRFGHGASSGRPHSL